MSSAAEVGVYGTMNTMSDRSSRDPHSTAPAADSADGGSACSTPATPQSSAKSNARDRVAKQGRSAAGSAPKKVDTRASLQASPEAEADADFVGLDPEDDRIDRIVVVGEGVRAAATWAVRLLILLAVTVASWYVMKTFWRGVLPVLLSLILCTVLVAPVSWMRKHRIPAGLAAAITLLCSFAGMGTLITFIAPDVLRQSRILYLQAFEGIQSAQLWLQGPPLNLDPADLDRWVNDAAKWLQENSGKIAGGIFSGIGLATTAAFTLMVVLVLTFFFLKDGHRFLPWLSNVVGRRTGWHLTEVLTRAWTTLSGFIRAQALVSLIDAVFIGLGIKLIGVPMALALSVLTFFAGFIPIVGAVVAGAIAVFVALASLGLGPALLTLLVVLVVQQLEGNVLSPILQSKAMNLHPVIVLVSVTIGGGLFGIMGAFLAVPFAAMVAVGFRYLQDMTTLRTGEKTSQDITFSTPEGLLAGRYAEEAGRRLRESMREELIVVNEDILDRDTEDLDAEATLRAPEPSRVDPTVTPSASRTDAPSSAQIRSKLRQTRSTLGKRLVRKFDKKR